MFVFPFYSYTAPLSSELANKEEVDFSGLPGLSPLAEALTPQMKYVGHSS